MNNVHNNYQHNIKYGKAVTALIYKYINPNVALTVAPNMGPQTNKQLDALVKRYFDTFHYFLIGKRWKQANNRYRLIKAVAFYEKQGINGHAHIIAEFHPSFIATPQDQVKLMQKARAACKAACSSSTVQVGPKVKLKKKKFSFEGLEPSSKLQLLFDADGWIEYITKTSYHNSFKTNYSLF